MLDITIRCYAELNDFLSPERRSICFSISLPISFTIEELMIQLGIPSAEIDLILVNDHSVGLTYRIEHHDRIALFPAFESLNIGSITKVHSSPLRRPKFVLDVHLGKLSRHLRMIGFDTLYQNDFSKEGLIRFSTTQHRMLLSRDKSLIEDERLTHAHLIMNINPQMQLIEVIEKFDLYDLANPFTRCIECNTLLQTVAKESIEHRIPPLVKEWCSVYQHCIPCDRVYWQGSHFQKMNAFIQEILLRKKESKEDEENNLR